MNEISSRQNPKFKSWLSCQEGRGIKKGGRALISGEKLVREFLDQNPKLAEDLIYPAKFDEIAAPSHVKHYRLNSALFNAVDSLGTKSPVLCVKTPEIPTWPGGAPNGLELIVALSDPGNMGAVLRSAEAFGVRRVILTQEACSPFLPRAIRAASGAAFRLSVARVEKPLAQLDISNGCALDMHGEDLARFAWPHDLYLILGEEGRGVPESLKLKSLSIAMNGKTESLNATIAASIALFAYRQYDLVKSK